jgi:hypothetical protein
MTTALAFTADTSFADAITSDETLFDRLVAYNPVFHKFSRVVMRDDVAPQLALGDLASMAGVPSADVLAVARGRAPKTPAPSSDDPVFTDSRGQAPRAFNVDTHTLDVRGDLDHGHEPLGKILAAVAALNPGQDLVIETTFHAVPLRRLLNRRGFASFAEQITDDHWRIRFRRSAHHGTSCCGRCGGNG